MYGFAYQSHGQDTLVISSQDLIERVLEHNPQIRIAGKQLEMAQGDYSQTNSLFLPSVTASYTSMYTNNPLMAFGSKLNQEVLAVADFDPAALNDPDPINNYATDIQILQPLLNLDGTHQRKAAKIQTEAYELQASRTMEYMELEAAKAYMHLRLAYEATNVLERAKKTADRGAQMVQNFYDEGLVQKTDVLAAQVRQVEVENQLKYSRSQIRNASDYLSVLLGEEADGKIYKPDSQSTYLIEEELFASKLPTFRKDLSAMDKSVEGYEQLLKSNNKSSLPRINAFGSYQLYDDKLLSFGANGYLVGVQLSWNLFNGYKNIGKVHKAKAELEKAQIENENYKSREQVELNKANRQLADARAKVSLSKQVLEKSSEAYRIRKDRFVEGLEKTTDVLMSENQMFQKELEYRQAIFEYNFAKEYLRFLTR